MNGPRRQISALLGQLAAEPGRRVLIVEGESDRDALRIWAREHDHPYDIYHVNEFDLKIRDEFRVYGGNKGRIITLKNNLHDENIDVPNLLGLIDRDIDPLVGNLIILKNLIYTNNASLFCHVATSLDIDYNFRVVFRRSIEDSLARRAVSFAKDFLAFRAALTDLGIRKALLPLKKYVGIDFTFDWDRYTTSMLQGSGVEIGEFRKKYDVHKHGNQYLDYHSFMRFLWHSSRNSRLISTGITLEEFYRAFFHRYILRIGSCPTVNQLS